ncbi:MAG TPA: DUF2306 domain-containing protein [Gammaproteobacteria bacterium]
MLRRALWCGVVILVLIGVATAIARAVFLDDLVTRGERFRQQRLSALERNDPYWAERRADVQRFDGRFAAHRLPTLLHVLPGGMLLTLAPLQFSRRIRSRHLRFHRWSGRALILTSFVVVLTGLYFGVLMPFGGPSEAIATALFGGFCLASVCRAFLAIRRHDVARHREWMIRAFAIAIGISTIRIVGGVFDFVLTPAGYRSQEVFVLAFWTGWLITLATAELWIRYTRQHSRSLAAAPSAA